MKPDEHNSSPSLSIVLPCFRPSPGWQNRVLFSYQKISELLPGTDTELIIVNDGTPGLPDESAGIFREQLKNFRWISYQANRGKGYALRKGIEAAEGNSVIFTDIDFPYTEESLVAIYMNLQSGGGDIVAGIRNEDYYRNVPPFRRKLSLFFRWLMRNLLNLKITDTQCGLKGFNREGRGIFLKTSIDRFLFDLELIFLGSNDTSIVVKGVPVQLKPDVKFSKMNWKILMNESLNFNRILFRHLGKKIWGKK